MSSSTVRIGAEDLTKLKEISTRLGVSLEKCISKILKLIDQDPATGELLIKEEQLDEERLASEIKKNRNLLYRIIRTVCALTEDDVKNPEFNLTLVDLYEDKNKHPEKYRK